MKIAAAIFYFEKTTSSKTKEPFFLLNILFTIQILESSFPFNKVLGLAVGVLINPKVKEFSEVARLQKILFLEKFSSATGLFVKIVPKIGKNFTFRRTEPFTTLSV